jgi:DNA-binding response OmpR family regulator
MVATSGREVLSFAKSNDYDAILLDLVLPEISGMEILKKLKSGKEYNPKIKVIIFSNLSDHETQEEALKNGADGFIFKTQFNPSELVAEIQRIINEYREQDKNETRRKNGNGHGAEDKKKTILFIEDEEVFLEMFGKKLEDDGYGVEYARNGAWGLKEALKKNFDLIILDMVMPAMTGEEMVHQLKLDEKTKNIPVIMLSASVEDENFKRIKEMGVGDFFVKTKLIPSDLSKRVGEIMDRE